VWFEKPEQKYYMHEYLWSVKEEGGGKVWKYVGLWIWLRWGWMMRQEVEKRGNGVGGRKWGREGRSSGERVYWGEERGRDRRQQGEEGREDDARRENEEMGKGEKWGVGRERVLRGCYGGGEGEEDRERKGKIRRGEGRRRWGGGGGEESVEEKRRKRTGKERVR
jgi:hypothetical protein